jgi:hypothetical protein
MTNTAFSQFWWEEVPGPRRVRAEICEALKLAKSVVLTGTMIPWSKELRSLISKEFQDELDIYTDEISSSESTKDPASYLLNKFGHSEDANNYREGVDPPLPEYLRKIKAIERKLIYVSGKSEDEFASWGAFLNRYKPKNPEDGIFLVETSVPVDEIAVSGKMVVVDTTSKFSFYDVLSFSIYLASRLDYSELWKHYAAWAAALVYEKDIESIADVFANVLPGVSPENIHAVILQRTADRQHFKQSIWKTQLQILFPLIESLRTNIVSRYYQPIKDVLVSGKHDYYGRRILDPFDSELGFLTYLGSLNNNANDHLFPYDIYQEICFLHECRNKLAHLEFCDIPAINQIIKISGRL